MWILRLENNIYRHFNTVFITLQSHFAHNFEYKPNLLLQDIIIIIYMIYNNVVDRFFCGHEISTTFGRLESSGVQRARYASFHGVIICHCYIGILSAKAVIETVILALSL